MIITKNLSYAYDLADLSFPDWEIEKGDHALILGASGGGKTTMLHLLGGLLSPTTGYIKIGDTEINELSRQQLDLFRGKHFGFVFQKPHLIPSLSVYENIKLANFLGKRSIPKSQINEVLNDLGIGDLASRKIYQISQGQAQRVAIARAVINNPDIIFGDEPTASLDDESCEAVIDLLKKQAEKCDATLVIATHDQRVKKEFANQLTL